jgi:hypothetical protein
VVRKERNDRPGGGVAICVNKKLKYSRRDRLYDGDGKIAACTIELYTGQDKILIVSYYKQPQMKIKLTVWKTFFAQFKGKFLIGGDFNGHHHSWGNSKNCTSGNNLYHCMIELETNITWLNDGSLVVTGSKRALNLTFVDPRSALLYTWKVGTDPWNTDHYPISIKYNGIIEPGKYNKKAFRLHNKDTDWTVFMEKVKEKLTEVKTHSAWNRDRDVKERYENFIQIIKRK